MSASYTPGPWAFQPLPSRIDPEESQVIWAGDHCLITVAGVNARANARLVGHAPEIVEALRALLEAVEADKRVRRGDYVNERRAARAAISIAAKAGGRS